MKTKAHLIFSKRCARTRYYDAIPSTDDGHPVDLAVQRWMPHGPEQRRILNVQDELLAALAPAARPLFLELEELRNTCSAEREEAYFDAGVEHGIERERGRLPKFSPAAARVAARVRRAIERAELEPHEGGHVLVEIVAECAASLVELHPRERKSRRRRGAHARST